MPIGCKLCNEAQMSKILSVADAGLVVHVGGGSVIIYYSIACEVHVEILGPCPLLMKIRPLIEHF